ncbi:hypothetical protein [Halocynthiibacter namhaensis]|uniref:hypothetical protein n=1 Tax=Halocynthiibacter namhaensis TaxID=1290553 RepID=UPI0012DFFB60|nr:hypothetical protein [Halocynthiibacter namhaensis]
MDIEKQLKNVAFGGSWSEEILVNARFNGALIVIANAVVECRDHDVRTPELHEALDYVREKINKGPELASSFLVAVGEVNPDVREQSAGVIFRNIKRWAGG